MWTHFLGARGGLIRGGPLYWANRIYVNMFARSILSEHTNTIPLETTYIVIFLKNIRVDVIWSKFALGSEFKAKKTLITTSFDVFCYKSFSLMSQPDSNYCFLETHIKTS